MIACMDSSMRLGVDVFLSSLSFEELEIRPEQTNLFVVPPVDMEDTGILEDMIMPRASDDTENPSHAITWEKLILALAAVIAAVCTAYFQLDNSIGEARKEAAAQLAASEGRIMDSLKSIDARLQGLQGSINSFQTSSLDNDRKLIGEIADLRVRQTQVEAK